MHRGGPWGVPGGSLGGPWLDPGISPPGGPKPPRPKNRPNHDRNGGWSLESITNNEKTLQHQFLSRDLLIGEKNSQSVSRRQPLNSNQGEDSMI